MTRGPRDMTTRVTVSDEDVRAMLRAYARYPREVERETERAADRHARALVPEIRSAAAARSRQAKLAAQSVRYVGSKPPTIAAGGTVTLRTSKPRRRPVRGGDVFFGSEFGGTLNRQFPPRSPGGWWYLPTVTRSMGRLRRQYRDALEKAARRWGTGG